MNNERLNRRSSFTVFGCGVLIAAGSVMLPGCDGKQQAEVAMRRACLSRLGEVYHQFHTEQERSPASVEEFASVVEASSGADDQVAMELAKRMREGDIMPLLNATLKSGDVDNDGHILAFEATCPSNGGYIVTVGGLVDHVTAKKFESMGKVEHVDPR